MDSPSNSVVLIPARNPEPRPDIPAPLGGDSSHSVADTIFDVIKQAGHIASAVTASIPEPVLAALIRRAERGHPATRSPELRAANAEQASIATAPPAFGVATAALPAELLLYAALAALAWRYLR